MPRRKWVAEKQVLALNKVVTWRLGSEEDGVQEEDTLGAWVSRSQEQGVRSKVGKQEAPSPVGRGTGLLSPPGKEAGIG